MAAYAALLSLDQTTDLKRNQEKHRFSIGAEEKIRSIHEYVASLLWFLKDYPEKANRRLEGKIREVAHKAEDIIEHFMLQGIESSSSHVGFEEQLENVTEQIGLIAGEVTEERPADHLPAASVLSSSRFAPAAVIGLDNDLMKMKKWLCGDPSDLQVIPIVGMGGIGKTTLATTVYHDRLIVERFDIRAWVAVSQNYSPSRFWKTLLGLVDPMKLLEEQMSRDEIDESEIALQVFKILKRRRYLVIMDDVWGKEVWDDVRNIFPDDNNGSRIMLTTRQLDIATYVATSYHAMELLNESQSWVLLKENVFTNNNCPSDLEAIGKEIARRCAGLPLAVVLVAGILSPVNETRASWEEIAKTVNPVVDREIEEILSLSYTNLPHHLRPCFLLFGGFLEDVDIPTSRLIKLWVAEGFLVLKHQNGCSKSLEEEAEVYLEDLVNRNLVMVTSRKSNGKIKSCSLHDMVRDLCIRKAQEEKFLHVMDGRDLPQGMINERRICFSRSDIDDIWGPTIRTVLCFQIQNSASWLASLGRYKLPRVLEALGVDLKELPFEVFDLYQLRYLALTGSLKIPSAISNLLNLQTLIIHLAFGKLRGRYEYANLVSHLEIWRMPQLRHLVFYAPYMLPHPPDDGLNLPLQNLQTLLLVKDLVWTEKILQMIPNVKRLGLVYTIHQKYDLHHLKDLHQLEKLEVTGYLGFSWRRQNPSFPSALKKLTLVGGGFPWRKMALVGSLPNLEVLKLLDYACVGETWEACDEEFPQLKFLLIDGSRLREWKTHASSFPRLKRLVLRFCWFLTEIPEGIGDIPTLELIEVGYCRKSLVESAKEIKEYQECCGNDAVQVRASHEDIQSCYKRKNLSSDESEDQLRNVKEKIGLVDKRLAILASAISSSSRLAPTGKDVVIGLNDDLMAIKDLLCGESSKLRVIPIVGKGGIGKTTLARTVYGDPLIKRHFQIHAWVTISQDYSPEEILLHLVYSMNPIHELEVYESLNRQILGEEIDKYEMAVKVHKNLKGRRYLIIMDNIWSTEVLDDVRNIFPDDSNGSRIIITTRLLDVTSYLDSNSPSHQMRSMDDYQSWDLLKQKVFKNSNCPPDLEDICKKIAKNCVGLRLAIVLVAGFLCAFNKTQASWEEIAQNVSPVVDQKLEEILSLSYTYLPYHLRPFLLFIGGFPKDADIRASRLVKLWVAEGLLEHKKGFEAEAEAEEYLEDLGNRNLVMVTSRKSNGKIKSCSLNDLVRDLCIQRGQVKKVLPQCMMNDDKIWGPTIHSIICFKLHGFPKWVAFSGCFRLLRQLVYIHKEFPSEVFELINLRYLALNVTSKIPSLSAISNLCDLQTLIIRPAFRGQKRYWRYDKHASVISLPLEIWWMRQLRHVVFYYLYTLPHPRDGSIDIPLQNLQTLLPVKNLVWTVKIVQMIPNVKRLGLVYTTNQDYHLYHLNHLRQLEKLEIDGSSYYSWREQFPSFPRTLKKLTLVGGGYPWERMDIIGSLPNLEILKLLDYACDGDSWKTTNEEFSQLKFLLIDASHLRQWITQSSPFPRLKCLVLRSCENLTEIPKGIGENRTLELIEVDCCRKSLVESAKQIREDYGNDAVRVRASNELVEEQDNC